MTIFLISFLVKLSYEYEQRRIAGETLQIQVKESENLTNRLRIRLDKAAHKASCEKAALENELDSLKEEYEQTRQECDRYQKGVESIQGELADRRNKYSQLESAFASLRCQADDDKEKANQDRNVLIKQVETTKTDLESLSAVHDAFKATLTELQGKMEDSKNQVAALEKQLADFKASAAREAEKLKAELQSSDLELKQLSFECQQAKIAKEELQSQMQNSKNLISSLEKHLADVTERALLEKTQLEEELRSARLDLKQVSSDHKQCQNTVLELEANVQKALSEKSRHEDDLRSTKNELQQVSSECRQCQTAKLELQAHVQTANKLVADLEKQLYDLRHQSRNDSDLHAHVQNSNNMVMNLERQLADIREQLRREKQDSEATRSAPLLDAPIVEVAVSKQPRKRAPPKASRKKQEIPAPRPRSPSPQTSGDFMDEASDYEPDGADDPAPESPVEPVDAPILEATVRRSPRKRAPPKTSKKKQQVPARRPRSPSVEPLEDPAEPSDHEPEDAPIAEATVIKPPRKRAPPKTSKMKQEIPPPSPNSPSAEPLEDANAGTSGYELDSVTVGPLDIPIGKAAVSKPPRKRAPPKASKKKQEILPPRSRSPSADPVEHGPDSVDHSVPKPPVGQPSHYMQGSSIDDILAATATAEEAKRANTKAEGKKPAKRAASGGRKKKDAPLAPAVEPVNMDTASANSPDEAPSEPAPSRKRKLGSKRTLASDVIPDAEADDEVDPPKPAKKRATAKTATRKRATNKKTSSEAEAPSPISAPQPPSPTPASGVLTSASDAPNIPNQVDPSPQQKPAPSDSDRPRLSLENRAALAENVRPTIKNRLLNLNAEGRMQFKPRPNMDPERMKKLFLGFGLGS
ncbi:hypothetical protein DFS34DRAFT_110956 [Phlyctochytrium arcticum]|nr:hypothetical protein DFS34DRAFT_110956 [Phlyctochytrium arcticum]